MQPPWTFKHANAKLQLHPQRARGVALYTFAGFRHAPARVLGILTNLPHDVIIIAVHNGRHRGNIAHQMLLHLPNQRVSDGGACLRRLRLPVPPVRKHQHIPILRRQGHTHLAGFLTDCIIARRNSAANHIAPELGQELLAVFTDIFTLLAAAHIVAALSENIQRHLDIFAQPLVFHRL